MTNPFNRLPTDPEWVKRHDELSKQAAKELDCMVILIALKEGGKLGVTVDGVPDSGRLHEMSKNLPRMLALLASFLALNESVEKMEPRQ